MSDATDDLEDAPFRGRLSDPWPGEPGYTKTTPPDDQEWLNIIVNQLVSDVLDYSNGQDIRPGRVSAAKAAITAEIKKRVLHGKIDELKQLASFLKSAHLYDQDAAMKLRYHFDKRLAALQQELDNLNQETLL